MNKNFGSYDTLTDFSTKSVLDTMSTKVFDDATMRDAVGDDVFQRFKNSLKTGAPTEKADQDILASSMFEWAKRNGAIGYAHWFFPMRGGGGAPGGTLGALKQVMVFVCSCAMGALTRELRIASS